MGKKANVKVIAVMTAGRYENTWCRNQIELGLRALNIPMAVSGGVYYGQCMQNMLQKAIDQGLDYAITIDGDSVFTPNQLQRLVSIAEQEKHRIDAICGMQIRRGYKTILGTFDGKTKADWDGYPVKVRTAHFGLTVLNLSKLAVTPRPWFFCQPNAEGNWDGDKIDSDVWFWQQWHKAGNTIYMDPEVRLGHLEEMIAVQDADLNPTHIYPADWADFCSGKAAKAVEGICDRACV